MMINDLKNVCQKKWVTYAFYAIMALVVAIPIIGSILTSGVDCDSAFYLCLGERIAEGYVPYVDITFAYTPLWFYIVAGFKLLFHIPNGVYWPYLILFYAFQIGGAYFLFRLARCLDIKKSISIFASWLYLLMSHWLQGNDVLLEVPSMTFCILACWLVLEFKDKGWWHYIWIGCLATCSFLVKQYGLGTFALCLYLMLFISKCNWKQFVAFIVGYMIPLLICLLIWKGTFIHATIFSGYGTQSAVDAGYEGSFSSRINSIFEILNYFCYMVCPAVYVGWLFAPLAYQKKRLEHLIFAYCGILGYSLVFYIQGGNLHYYQNLLPFAVLLMVELLHITRETKFKYITYVLIGCVILVSSYKTYHNRVYKQYIVENERLSQQSLTRNVSQYIQDDETLFVIHGGLFYLFFTTDALPPNLTSVGYSFGPLGLNEQSAFKQINEADWVIRFSHDYDYESFFTDSLKHYLESYPAVCLNDSAVLLHKMH